MAINKKLIHFKTKAAFEAQLNNILDTSIVFIQDANLIWTHGTYYCLPNDDVVISDGIEPDKDQDLWIDTSDNTTATFNEVYVGETEPTNGEIVWINPDTDVMKYWNGTEWVTVSGKPVPETLIINLASNQTNPDNNLNGVIVNIRYADTDHRQAWGGEALSFNIPDGTEYTIEYSDITDSEGNKIYATPTAETYTAVGNKTRILSIYYNCCKLTIKRKNNQNVSLGDTSATVTYSSYSQTVNLTSPTNSATITIPYNVDYTIAFGAITDFQTPPNITGTSNSKSTTQRGTYNAEKLTVKVSGVSSGFTITVNGQDQTSTSWIYYIPYGTTYTISASLIKGYTIEISESSITASQKTRTVTVTYTKKANGIYICDNTGALTAVESWNTANNSSAIGVAVVSDNCSFVIEKTASTSKLLWERSGSGTEISGIVTTKTESIAKTDYSGEINTTKIINQLGSGSAPANYCRGRSCTVNGTTLYGYLGALGELQTAYDNKAAVNIALNKIGGTAMGTNSGHWTSTQGSAATAWALDWTDGYVNYGFKDNDFYVRAFYPLP